MFRFAHRPPSSSFDQITGRSSVHSPDNISNSPDGVGPMMGTFKVFSHPSVERVVVRELGMTMEQFLRLGAAVTGHFQNNWGMSTDQDYAVLGISQRVSQAFFDRITSTIDDLRSAIDKHQSYGPDWLYTWREDKSPVEVRRPIRHPQPA